MFFEFSDYYFFQPNFHSNCQGFGESTLALDTLLQVPNCKAYVPNVVMNVVACIGQQQIDVCQAIWNKFKSTSF